MAENKIRQETAEEKRIKILEANDMNIKEEAIAVKSMTMTDGWRKVLAPRLQEWRKALIERLVTVTEHPEVIRIQQQVVAIDKLFNTIEGVILEGNDEHPQEEDSLN